MQQPKKYSITIISPAFKTAKSKSTKVLSPKGTQSIINYWCISVLAFYCCSRSRWSNFCILLLCIQLVSCTVWSQRWFVEERRKNVLLHKCILVCFFPLFSNLCFFFLMNIGLKLNCTSLYLKHQHLRGLEEKYVFGTPTSHGRLSAGRYEGCMTDGDCRLHHSAS